MCFVFIWEQTSTCATYSINWLVFTTEMKSVYCAVRTGYLNKAVCASYSKGQTMKISYETRGRLDERKSSWQIDDTTFLLILFLLEYLFILSELDALLLCHHKYEPSPRTTADGLQKLHVFLPHARNMCCVTMETHILRFMKLRRYRNVSYS